MPHISFSSRKETLQTVLAKDGNIGLQKKEKNQTTKKTTNKPTHPNLYHFMIMHTKASAQERKAWIVLMC